MPAETETERLIRLHKPQFVRWTDWILDGDAVTYGGGGGWKSPSACRWIIPHTGEDPQRPPSFPSQHHTPTGDSND